MQSIYIVRTRDARLHCFYHANESGINLRTYEQNRWGKAINIVPDASQNYTVTLTETGAFYIFCSDSAGNIHLCQNDGKDGNWPLRLILRNQSPIVHAVVFWPLIKPDGLKLIYNVPSPEDRTHFIMTQQLYQNGEWGTPSRLDRITALQNNIFAVQQTAAHHKLLFYQTKTPETNLGCREVTGEHAGDFHLFHTTTYQITDTSFLTTPAAIHALYVVKSMFSSQLVYKKRDAAGFSAPVTVWEAQRIENCSLFIISETLYLSFISGGILYIAQSSDGGATFTRPLRYRGDFCKMPVRAVYLSETEMDERHYYCREVYVDRHSPFDIQILPDLIDGFYDAASPGFAPPELFPAAKTAAQNPMPATPSTHGYVYTDHYDPFAAAADFTPPVAAASYEAPFRPAPPQNAPRPEPARQEQNAAEQSGNTGLTMLRSSLQAALQQNANKDKQLESLTNLVAAKNRELKSMEKHDSDSRRMLARQIEQYKAENEQLKQALEKAQKPAGGDEPPVG